MISNVADIFYQKTTFGDLLRRLRREKSLSLLDMMEKTGIYYGRLSEYESGIYIPDATKIYKLCDALGLDRDMRARMLEVARDVCEMPHEPAAVRSAYAHPRQKASN